MSEPITLTLVLVGAHAGKDVTLNHRVFRKGECVFSGQPEQIWGAVAYLRNYYGAYIKDSAEHLAAQEAYDNSVGKSVVPDLEKLKKTLASLDHSDNLQWTKNGKPSLAFLEETLKFPVTKEMIESVGPIIKRSI